MGFRGRTTRSYSRSGASPRHRPSHPDLPQPAPALAVAAAALTVHLCADERILDGSLDERWLWGSSHSQDYVDAARRRGVDGGVNVRTRHLSAFPAHAQVPLRHGCHREPWVRSDPCAKHHEENQMHTTKWLADPVCGMAVDPATAIQVNVDESSYYFCESACADTFREDPKRWVQPASPLHEHD